MSNWQFSQAGYVINGSPTEERDADTITLFDTDGCVVISVKKEEEAGWHISASDFYLNWTHYSERYFLLYRSALDSMFRETDHDHEVSETAEIRVSHSRKYAVCDLCGIPCDLLDTE